jgi:hypothetical protein
MANFVPHPWPGKASWSRIERKKNSVTGGAWSGPDERVDNARHHSFFRRLSGPATPGRMPSLKPGGRWRSRPVADLSPGDVVHIEDAVALTVLAVEGDLIRFGLETPEGASPDAGPACQQADPTQGWWELN